MQAALQEWLVLDGHNHIIYIPSFSAAISVFWQLPLATFPASHESLVWTVLLSVFSYNTKTLHFPLFQQNWKASFLHIVTGWNGNSSTWCSLKASCARMQRWRLFLSSDSCRVGEFPYFPGNVFTISLSPCLPIKVLPLTPRCLASAPHELQWINNHGSFAEKSTGVEIHQ